MTAGEFDGIWNRVTALWAGWARKIGKGGALVHVQKEWWRMLRDVALAAAEEAVSAHWQEAGAKFAPDPTAIASRCGTTTGRAVTPEEKAAALTFYMADRIDQHRMLADAAARRASQAQFRGERDAAVAELKLLAGYALRMARAAAATLERLAADPQTTPELLNHSTEISRRSSDVALRIATLARVQTPNQETGDHP